MDAMMWHALVHAALGLELRESRQYEPRHPLPSLGLHFLMHRPPLAPTPRIRAPRSQEQCPIASQPPRRLALEGARG